MRAFYARHFRWIAIAIKSSRSWSLCRHDFALRPAQSVTGKVMVMVSRRVCFCFRFALSVNKFSEVLVPLRVLLERGAKPGFRSGSYFSFSSKFSSGSHGVFRGPESRERHDLGFEFEFK